VFAHVQTQLGRSAETFRADIAHFRAARVDFHVGV
jgi:hypothetical protein